MAGLSVTRQQWRGMSLSTKMLCTHETHPDLAHHSLFTPSSPYDNPSAPAPQKIRQCNILNFRDGPMLPFCGNFCTQEAKWKTKHPSDTTNRGFEPRLCRSVGQPRYQLGRECTSRRWLKEANTKWPFHVDPTPTTQNITTMMMMMMNDAQEISLTGPQILPSWWWLMFTAAFVRIVG